MRARHSILIFAALSALVVLGRDARALRAVYGALWSMLRHEAGGLTPRLPRLWSI